MTTLNELQSMALTNLQPDVPLPMSALAQALMRRSAWSSAGPPPMTAASRPWC